MKNSLKILSLTSFVFAVPALIVVDWFYKGYGILIMFILATVGLVLDQAARMKYPSNMVVPLSNYHTNKLLNIFTIILLVQSPMALIFGNKVLDKLGFWLMSVMICLGIVFNQIARLKFSYYAKKENEE
ncbi:MAG: hypothetical protein ACK5MV_04280 [Aminipila sp.]